MAATGKQVRDLEADLAICEVATPGPWITSGDCIARSKTDSEGWHDVIVSPRTPRPGRADMCFLAEAREGWPYAIRRALEAEAEIDRLRNELNILQEQYYGRCMD